MTAATHSDQAGIAHRALPLWLAVVAIVAALLAAAIGSSSTTPAEAYEPAPTPTATAEPAPTPIPEPTPTQEPALPPPPPEPNFFFNPPNPPIPTVVIPGVLEVPREEVFATPPRFYVFPAEPRLRDAPRADRKVNGRFVPIYSAGDLVRLVAKVPANTEFRVLIRRAGRGNEYQEAATVLSDPNGRVALPVLRVSRRGTYIIALVDVATGQPLYLKIDVARRGT